MRCLVTGAAGFMGSHLTYALLKRDEMVRAFIHYHALGTAGWLEDAVFKPYIASGQLEIIAGDVLDAGFVRESIRGCHRVFHLAALIGIPYSYVAPQSYVQINVKGALHVLEACRAEEVERIVFTSTSEVYGTAQSVPMTEAHPLKAQSPYAATKIASDQLATAYAVSFGLPVVIARPFNAYGPRQSMRAVIPTILYGLLSAECERLELGSLTPVRDYTFVEDIAEAFCLLGWAEGVQFGEVYHFGSGEGRTIARILELACEVVGCRKPVEVSSERIRPPLSEVMALICDASKMHSVTGWVPRISFEEGLVRVVEALTIQVAKPSVLSGCYQQ